MAQDPTPKERLLARRKVKEHELQGYLDLFAEEERRRRVTFDPIGPTFETSSARLDRANELRHEISEIERELREMS